MRGSTGAVELPLIQRPFEAIPFAKLAWFDAREGHVFVNAITCL